MWLSFAFLSAALLGLYDVFKKRALSSNAVIPVLFLNTLLCSCIFLPFVCGSSLGEISAESALFIPIGDFSAHLHVLLKAAIVLSSWICGYFAIKHLPLTIVGPVNATRPVMTLLGALIIFGEHLNLWQWIGVLLSLFSIFLLSKSSKKEGINFTSNHWLLLLFTAALLGSISGLYDKHLMSETYIGGAGLDKLFVQAWYNIYQAVMMCVILLTLWYPKRKTSTPFRWRWSILFIPLFLTAADMAYFYALSHTESMISLVSMIRRSSVIVSFAFGALMFHEKNLRTKIFDLLLILLGMLCIYFGSL